MIEKRITKLQRLSKLFEVKSASSAMKREKATLVFLSPKDLLFLHRLCDKEIENLIKKLEEKYK